jgi:hypothetical protein
VPSTNYSILVNHEIASLKRMIGGFPEASAFGYYTLGLFGFWFRYAALSHGKRYPSLFLLLSVFLLFRSASTSAYLAIGLFLILYVALNTQSTLGRAISARTARLIGFSALLMVLLACGAVAAYELIPDVKTFLDRLLFNKLETDSGVERLSWNARALENLQDTFGIGAGLGSLRASNWLIATLASIGVLGAIIFIAFLLSMFRTSGQRAVSEYYIVIEALKYGCLGLFLRAMVVKATPNLEIIFFAYAGLLVGLAAAKPSIPARSRESG